MFYDKVVIWKGNKTEYKKKEENKMMKKMRKLIKYDFFKILLFLNNYFKFMMKPIVLLYLKWTHSKIVHRENVQYKQLTNNNKLLIKHEIQEWNVSIEKSGKLISEIQKAFKSLNNYPLIEFSFSKRSDIWLSPDFDRECCWVKFTHYYNDMAVFEKVHDLMIRFDGRFNWSNNVGVGVDQKYLKRVYQNFDNFLKIKNDLDGDKIFENDFLKNFFI
jgi:hypothetical protein